MKRVLSAVVLVVFLSVPFPAFASTTFSSIVALGDSLTDNGIHLDTYDAYGVKYFTDGPVWVESLADAMGSALFDVAYGGATTGYDNPELNSPYTGLLWQVDLIDNFCIDGSDTLFTVWAGANDFFQGRSADGAVANIATALDGLAGSGAANILVPNLPDLGLTPGFYASAYQLAATGWTQAFNQALFSELQDFARLNPDVDLYFLDIYSLFADLILTENGDLNAVFWKLLFYDDVHPSSIGHAIIAGEAYNVLQGSPVTAPVPVPAAVWLLGSGVLGAAAIRRRFGS